MRVLQSDALTPIPDLVSNTITHPDLSEKILIPYRRNTNFGFTSWFGDGFGPIGFWVRYGLSDGGRYGRISVSLEQLIHDCEREWDICLHLALSINRSRCQNGKQQE